ncbi:MAG: ribosome-associated translation inhibitor RaiA [Alphaproteobacteria bacterium]
MQTPLEIAFSNMDHSDAVEARVRERVERLERFHPGITSCHVVVQAPHKHHRKGKHYHVRIEARVPGSELVVSGKPGDMNAHEDVYVAIRDAFDAIERQLKKSRAQRGGEVKAHAAPLQGVVEALYPDQDHGEIATNDGRLIYFHRNSVLNGGFDQLGKGDTVELTVRHDESDKGPQASTVRPIGSLRFVDEPSKR